jgi:hypothetical protein
MARLNQRTRLRREMSNVDTKQRLGAVAGAANADGLKICRKARQGVSQEKNMKSQVRQA